MIKARQKGQQIETPMKATQIMIDGHMVLKVVATDEPVLYIIMESLMPDRLWRNRTDVPSWHLMLQPESYYARYNELITAYEFKYGVMVS